MKEGILVVNKPEGISSAGVVGRLKRILGVKKIGHTGTLDPFATGVLLIAVGKATRISRFFLQGRKGYRARVTLGIETDTFDCTGQITAKADPQALSHIDSPRAAHVVAGFKGDQEQVPPVFSALKHQGQPLYKLARQGKAVVKPPRQIQIHDISLSDFSRNNAGYPEFTLDVLCSGGTYIRSLAHDMGKALGCGAHLSALERTRSSCFTLEEAVDFQACQTMERSDISARMVPMARCLDFLPSIVASPAAAQKVKFGQKLTLEEAGAVLSPSPKKSAEAEDKSGCIRILDREGALLAVVVPSPDGPVYNYCCVFTA